MVRSFALRTAQFAVAVAASASFLAGAQTLGGPERYSATAVNEEGRGTSAIQIVVERWSTDAERDKLLATLLDKGPEKLLDALLDAPSIGYVRTPTGGRWDLHYARRVPLPDGGERVILATDRPLGFFESANQLRTVDDPFTIIELRLNPQGEGEGKLSFATRIIADKESGTIVLENYGIQPVLLQAVRREKTT